MSRIAPRKEEIVEGGASNSNSMTAKDYLALIDEVDIKTLRCSVTGNQAVAVCTNPNSPQKLLCASCLIQNVELVKKYRSEMIPIEDIKQRIMEGLNYIIGSNMIEEIDSDLQTFKSNLKQQLLMAVSEKFDEAFDKKVEDFRKRATSLQAEAPEGLEAHLLNKVDVDLILNCREVT